MLDVVEETHNVELGHPAVTSVDRFPDPPHRPLGTAPEAIAEAARQEVLLKQRLDYLPGGLLDHPVRDGGDPERAGSPIGFRNVHPPHRRRDVALGREQPPTQR